MHPTPRTSNLASRPVDKQELSQAQMALKSLKAKMGSAPRRPNPIMNIGANGTRMFIPTFDIDGQMSNQNYPTKPGIYNMNSNTPMMAKPQFVSNYKPSFNNIPSSSTNNRRPPLLGIMKYKSNQNIGNMYSNNIANNNEKYTNYSNQNYDYNSIKKTPVISNEDSDARPLDKGENCNKEKENVNPQQGKPTYPCPDCGRRFVQAVYDRHIKICKKVFQSKRKAFDIKQKRFNGEEQAQLAKSGEYREKMELKKKKKKNEPKWKKQSEELRQIAKGGEKTYYVPSDYILCKFCNRNYNEEAYKKHVSGCERRFKDAQLRGKYSTNNKKKYVK